MQFQRIQLNQPLIHGFLDRVEIDSVGLIRVVGWSKRTAGSAPVIGLDQLQLPLLQTYRVSRPDVESASVSQYPKGSAKFRTAVKVGLKLLNRGTSDANAREDPGVQDEGLADNEAGLVYEYTVPKAFYGRSAHTLSLEVPNLVALTFEIDVSFTEPHYRLLFDSEAVLKRDEIYGAGPPNTQLHPDIRALAAKFSAPLVDYGCGSGALVSALNASGVPCRGLELAGSPASVLLPPALRHLVTFYDGRFPSPIETASARTVFCSEVLEHIPDYDAAIQDMARIATERVVITVPDCSAIPLGSRHQLVPWHLLEGTHVNFFTQSSLERVLRPYFREISFGRVCPCLLNDTDFYVSIAACCSK
jgi:Methyltransferase domain